MVALDLPYLRWFHWVLQEVKVTMRGAHNYAELELSAALIRIRSKLDEIQSDDASLNAIDDIPQKSGCLRNLHLICVCVCVIFAAAAGLHALPVLT